MRAFTLLEIILYIGIFSLMLTGIFASARMLGDSTSSASTRARTLMKQLIDQDMTDQGLHIFP